MSHSERYFRTEFTTTAEDRAKLVRIPPSGPRRLKSYPVPLAMNGDTQSPFESGSSFKCHVAGTKGIPTMFKQCFRT